MNARIRYTLGLCLQVVGLLNFVFLVGVPIWWAGRRLCRDARTDSRPPPVVEWQSASADATSGHDHDQSSPGSSESRSERRVPVRRT